MKLLQYFIPIVLFIVSACSGSPDDSRLLAISGIVSDKPEEALASLDSIDPNGLSEPNRHFYDFLSIKAKDKAYVTHTSDSLILNVIDYYSRHKDSGLYPEALYYGGRVYRDIGDGPTALRFFRNALDQISKKEDYDLHCLILCQTGSLLNSMRLYHESSIYLKEAVRLDSLITNPVRLMRDIQLLGAVYLHSQEYAKADSCFNKAYGISRKISHEDSIIHIMYIAGTKLHLDEMDAAREKMRYVLSHIPYDYNRKDIINAYASQIYHNAGMYDSAYIYAKKLIKSHNNNYRKNGYTMLLSPELREYSSPDSLLSYSLAYREVLDEFLNKHDAEQLVTQTSLYNYERQESARLKAEKSMKLYMLIAGVATICILILIIIALYFRNRSTRNLLQYHEALQDISILRESLASEKDADRNPQKDEKDHARDRLKKELLDLQKEGLTKKTVPDSIKSSSAYDKLREYILRKKIITDTDKLWDDVEALVLEISPNFRSRLYLLAGERLKTDAYHLALLIRCGIRPVELSILTGRTKSTISSRRGYLCSSIFGEKYGAAVMDDIIFLL